MPKSIEVQVAEVRQGDVPLYREWIGTVDGMVNTEIEAQVSGYLVKQEYTEGSFVHEGQLLFQIDPRPFQAELDQAEQQFLRSTLAKIRTLREMIARLNPNCNLEVDGGIDTSTARLALEAGANVFVAGTHVFRDPADPRWVCAVSWTP